LEDRSKHATRGILARTGDITINRIWLPVLLVVPIGPDETGFGVVWKTELKTLPTEFVPVLVTRTGDGVLLGGEETLLLCVATSEDDVETKTLEKGRPAESTQVLVTDTTTRENSRLDEVAILENECSLPESETLDTNTDVVELPWPSIPVLLIVTIEGV
jgi:hypothetical protein